MNLKQLEDKRLQLLDNVDKIDHQITSLKNQGILNAAKSLHQQLSIVTEEEAYRLISMANISCNELSEFNLIQIFFLKYSKDYDKKIFNKKLDELINHGLLTKNKMIKDQAFINGRELDKDEEKSTLPEEIFYMYSTNQKYTDLVNPFLIKLSF